MVLHQHVVNRVRRVQQHVGTAEEAADQNILLVGGLGPHGERIGADRAQERHQRQRLRRSRRQRRDQQVGVRDVHAETSGSEDHEYIAGQQDQMNEARQQVGAALAIGKHGDEK